MIVNKEKEYRVYLIVNHVDAVCEKNTEAGTLWKFFFSFISLKTEKQLDNWLVSCQRGIIGNYCDQQLDNFS